MTILCAVCSHQSDDFIGAWEHRHEHRFLPPKPLLEEGMLVTFVHGDKRFTDYVTKVEFDPKTGRETMGVANPMARAMATISKIDRAVQRLIKPRWIPLWAWMLWRRLRR